MDPVRDRGSMDPVHERLVHGSCGPRWGSMDPWSTFCPHPDTNTVKPPISNHPKYKDLVIANGRCSIMRIDKQEVSSKTRS